MSLESEKRKKHRVTFSHSIPVRIVAIDGTWNRECLMLDVSDEGARLSIVQSVEGLRLQEFFLVLSTTGSVFRRCQVAWINGGDMGVHFIEKSPSSKAKT